MFEEFLCRLNFTPNSGRSWCVFHSVGAELPADPRPWVGPVWDNGSDPTGSEVTDMQAWDSGNVGADGLGSPTVRRRREKVQTHCWKGMKCCLSSSSSFPWAMSVTSITAATGGGSQ